MNQIIINGKFMESGMQGIVRYAREMLLALDELIDSSELSFQLAVSQSAKNVPEYKNISVVQIGKRSGILWEQTDLRAYVNANKGALCLNLCNVCPLFTRPGITVVHDIMYTVNPSHYTTLRNRLSRIWHMFLYSYIVRHEKKILTVSLFSQKEIERCYPAAKGKISVIPCGWQHVLEYTESDDWQERFPFLKPSEFYFSLATLAKNKNGKWIMDAARRNPEAVFAIAGKHYETEYTQIPHNVHLLGFVSDEDACALIKNCKAFIFPSLYEGFGLPPLEALALGAEVISSNAASLPEVLGDSVHYIEPYDANVDIDALMDGETGDKNSALEKYSWKKSAKLLLDLLEKSSDGGLK